ncbi:hypothetical protein [Neisseria canis]|nr:hypothetical protein [Neisseria canis]
MLFLADSIYIGAVFRNACLNAFRQAFVLPADKVLRRLAVF